MHCLNSFFSSRIGRARQLAKAFGSVSLVLLSSVAHAQGFPSGPMRILVPHPPGGPTDIIARIFAERFTSSVGQPVIVESRAGGNGIVLMNSVIGAPADGHTLALATNTPLALQPAINRYTKVNDGADIQKQLKPVTYLGDSPMALAINPARGIRSVAQLIAEAKAKPGELRSGNGAGIGGADHLGTELFNLAVGIRSLAIPYKGIAAVAVALAAGEIDYAVTSVGAFIPMHNAGRLAIIAVASDKRLEYLPNVPTVSEVTGVPNFEATSWLGIWVNAAVEPRRIAALNELFKKEGANPEVREKVLKTGYTVKTSTPEQLQARVDGDLKKWSDLLNRNVIKF